ncbi:unnamed protein product [Alopecurus aequalis]
MMELRKYWGVGGRRCGSCEASPAAVHCRTCAGYLCTGCDARPAHARAGHERVWVCEVCEQNPAAVTCKADAAVLCAACDADIHDANPLAQRHVRVPVAPIGSPEAAAVAAEAMSMFAGGEARAVEHQDERQQQHGALNLNLEAGKEGEKQMDFLYSDLVDPYLGVDYARGFPHADSVVPGAGAVPGVELDFACGNAANVKPPPSSYGSYTATASVAHSGSSSEVGVVPDATFVGGAGAGSFELDFTRPKPQTYMPAYTGAPPHPGHGVGMQQVSAVDNTGYLTVPERAVAVTGEDREARLTRYREKRKNRRFEKTIRYASRKAYAEARPRVKGRFAKRTDDDADAEAGGVPSSYLLDFGYGVVPSF